MSPPLRDSSGMEDRLKLHMECLIDAWENGDFDREEFLYFCALYQTVKFGRQHRFSLPVPVKCMNRQLVSILRTNSMTKVGVQVCQPNPESSNRWQVCFKGDDHTTHEGQGFGSCSYSSLGAYYLSNIVITERRFHVTALITCGRFEFNRKIDIVMDMTDVYDAQSMLAKLKYLHMREIGPTQNYPFAETESRLDQLIKSKLIQQFGNLKEELLKINAARKAAVANKAMFLKTEVHDGLLERILAFNRILSSQKEEVILGCCRQCLILRIFVFEMEEQQWDMLNYIRAAMAESKMYSGLKVSRALLEEIERQNKMDEYRTQRGLLPLTAKASEPNFFELREYIQSRPWERQKNAQLTQRQSDGQPQNTVKRGRGRPRKDEKMAESSSKNMSPAAEPLQKKAK